ncbi:DsbA family protein [Cognatiyoonia sp. IB215446]|uniref:DsbA family protein n=1 Tax=Cognatiyoonia sp. IB215446 TaxID=3097355 RepID=UPI002A15AB80|nr:DsbA family protein [Cognatiyoonia sp. IB215446]MDX8348572.1 DsbA family protein [Cognatiyoonia sp. IB215446]
MIWRLALPLSLGLASGASALELDAMSSAERDAFRAEVRAYILENPEIIREAIGVLQAREAEAERLNDIELARANADALFNDGHSFVGGNPDGDITIVEFMDYRCGFCKRAFPEVQNVLSADGNIRYIIKEFPILGEPSVLAARYAIATQLVAGDDTYKVVHDTLMEFQGEISNQALARLSESFDLDHDAIAAMMDDDKVGDIITENRALAQQLQISGTPTFVVEDQMLRGFLPADEMLAVVAELRAE